MVGFLVCQIGKPLRTLRFSHELRLQQQHAVVPDRGRRTLIERFTRVDADTLRYDVTVDDPAVWTRPWTYSVPMRKNPEPVYEYACHEGNYGLRNILAGAVAGGSD